MSASLRDNAAPSQHVLPSAASRNLWTAPVLVLGVVIVYAVGAPGAWIRLGLALALFLFATWAIEVVCRRFDLQRLEVTLSMFLTCSVTTLALVVVGELYGPLVGLYALSVAVATLVSGISAGVATALFALAAYGVAIAGTHFGLIPLYPATLTGTWPAIGALVLHGIVLLAAFLLSLLVGGQTLEEFRAAFSRELGNEVAAKTGDLERANERLRELQQQVVRAGRIEFAEQLSGMVAHAINNPLTALLGQLEMECEEEEHSNERLTRSLQLARRIDLIVKQLLALFRQGELERTDEDPHDLLVLTRRDLSTRAREYGIEVVVRVEPGLPRIAVDRSLLVTALVSVAENGLDAMREGGGTLVLAARRTHDHVVEFSIEDSGPGVPLDLRERVFEPFFTTKGGGTGLGLAIARSIIAGHGGRLRVAEGHERGTLMLAEIPIRALDS